MDAFFVSNMMIERLPRFEGYSDDWESQLTEEHVRLTLPSTSLTCDFVLHCWSQTRRKTNGVDIVGFQKAQEAYKKGHGPTACVR